MKRFHIQYGVGKTKYIVSYHDGISKHSDGSDFFDMKIFRNKKDLAKFVCGLFDSGYVEKP